jgi:hypothetical protein
MNGYAASVEWYWRGKTKVLGEKLVYHKSHIYKLAWDWTKFSTATYFMIQSITVKIMKRGQDNHIIFCFLQIRLWIPASFDRQNRLFFRGRIFCSNIITIVWWLWMVRRDFNVRGDYIGTLCYLVIVARYSPSARANVTWRRGCAILDEFPSVALWIAVEQDQKYRPILKEGTSDENFLMHLFQTKQFTNTWKVSKCRFHSRRGEVGDTEDVLTGGNWTLLVLAWNISKKITCSTCAANGSVCVVRVSCKTLIY